MMLKNFSELNFHERNHPCHEYPGWWTVINGTGNYTFHKRSMTEAYEIARSLAKINESVSVYWECSMDDPRQKETWFNAHYKHGQFNIYSEWKLKSL